MKLTKEELYIFEELIIQNRDSKTLQNLTNCSYLKSIELLNKVRKLEEGEF